MTELCCTQCGLTLHGTAYVSFVGGAIVTPDPSETGAFVTSAGVKLHLGECVAEFLEAGRKVAEDINKQQEER